MFILNSGVWLLESGGQFVIKEAPFPRAGDDEIVIQNKAVAINPMDWKIQVFGPHLPFPNHYPFIIGADVAGEVYEIGKNVTTFRKGDRVIGVLPLALSTAAMGLYPTGRLKLPLLQTTKPDSIDKVVLIWGGSSSTGSAAIQLAVASGATVISTASKKNQGFVKSLGATTVLYHKSETIVQDLVQAVNETPGEFVGALDAIGEENTWRGCAEVVKNLGGGRVVNNLPAWFMNVPEGVEVVGVNDTAHLPNNKGIVEGVWGHFIPEALKNGSLRAVPDPLVIGKGLEKIPEGVALCQQGISAGKVVITL